MSEQISLRDELIKLLDREPFQAFTIVMTSGERYEVTDPHQLAVGESVMILIPPRSVSVTMRMSQLSSLEAADAMT